MQAKEPTNEIVRTYFEDFLFIMDKKEAVAEIEKGAKEKWQREFGCCQRRRIKYRKCSRRLRVGTALGKNIGITLPC